MDADVVSAAIQQNEGRELLFRDIRNLITLKTLEQMTPADVEYVYCTLNGMSKPEIRSRLGCKHNRIAEIGHSDIVKTAIIDAKRNIAQGLITSTDVAAAAESEILSNAYRLAINDNVELDMRHKFMKLVLDYRIQVMKAMPILSKSMEHDLRTSEIRIESEAKDKMSEHLRLSIVTPEVGVENIPRSKALAVELEEPMGEQASMTLPKT